MSILARNCTSYVSWVVLESREHCCVMLLHGVKLTPGSEKMASSIPDTPIFNIQLQEFLSFNSSVRYANLLLNTSLNTVPVTEINSPNALVVSSF